MFSITEKFDSSLSAPRARKREAHPTSEIEFVGFTLEQKLWIKKLLDYTGLPLEGIQSITFEPKEAFENSDGEVATIYDSISASAAYSSSTRIISVNKDWLLSLPRDSRAYALRIALIHEVAHSFNPLEAFWEINKNEADENTPAWLEGFAKQYPDHGKILPLLESLVDIGDQMLETGVHLNGYSRRLASELKKLHARAQHEDIDDLINLNEGLFITEVHAILIELLFTKPMHLAIVDESARRKHRALPEPKKPYISVLETAYRAYEAVTGLGYAETAGAIARSMLHARTNPF